MKQIILLIFLLAAFALYSQNSKPCKGYIIVQEKHFVKTGVRAIDSIFITEHYQYTKCNFQDLFENCNYSDYFNYKNKRYFKIIEIKKDEINGKKQLIEGIFVRKDSISHSRVCHDSVFFLDEQKTILGFNTQKVFIVWDSVSLKEKRLTSIAFIAEKTFNPNQSECIPGFILESFDNEKEIRTLNITECILPEDMDFILNGAKDIKVLEDTFKEFKFEIPR